MDSFERNVRCKRHHLLTCKVCLHSINSTEDGLIPHPTPETWIPCPESAHSIEPRYEKFDPTPALRGYHDGLSPEDRERLVNDRSALEHRSADGTPYFSCAKCKLRYFSGGGGVALYHPSHVSSNGQRYVLMSVHPLEFSRTPETIETSALAFFDDDSPMNVTFDFGSNLDTVDTADWNLDNVEITILVSALVYVKKNVIPHRKSLVEKHLYTNSEYFAGQAWRFTLVVFTSINASLLDFLLQAHKLKYNRDRGLLLERDERKQPIKEFPATEARWHLASDFVGVVKQLADLGIQVLFRQCEPDQRHEEARASFRDESYQPQDEIPEEDQRDSRARKGKGKMVASYEV
ncbi:hypothetical protein F5Y13DRAFT_152971 [Hypoxylon sp. FL1857]|nr:hypothetical protein F5Y13DRAFT_152971 [Hypoxylon sp. FL1857]